MVRKNATSRSGARRSGGKMRTDSSRLSEKPLNLQYLGRYRRPLTARWLRHVVCQSSPPSGNCVAPGADTAQLKRSHDGVSVHRLGKNPSFAAVRWPHVEDEGDAAREIYHFGIAVLAGLDPARPVHRQRHIRVI